MIRRKYAAGCFLAMSMASAGQVGAKAVVDLGSQESERTPTNNRKRGRVPPTYRERYLQSTQIGESQYQVVYEDYQDIFEDFQSRARDSVTKGMAPPQSMSRSMSAMSKGMSMGMSKGMPAHSQAPANATDTTSESPSYRHHPTMKKSRVKNNSSSKGMTMEMGKGGVSAPKGMPTISPAPTRVPDSTSSESPTSPPDPTVKKSMDKSSKSMKMIMSKGTKSSSTLSPATGPSAPILPTTRPPSSTGDCVSPVAAPIVNAVPEVFIQTPERCCNYNGPSAAIITHAIRDPSTSSSFEVFWDEMYQAIARTSNAANVCFFMTGIDNSASSRDLSTILMEVLGAASSDNQDIISIMTTDPTQNISLLQTVRSISNDRSQPAIGVFNSGRVNVITESIIEGQGMIPFVGYMDDSQYGMEAAAATLELLDDGTESIPVCFNARVGVLDFIGERCAAYYFSLSTQTITPTQGIACSKDSSPEELLQSILLNSANSVWGSIDCCEALGEAVMMARNNGISIVSGCQDYDQGFPPGIDFVTSQTIEQQAYQASVWANFPVLQEMSGNDGRSVQYFPGLDTFVNTAIYTTFQ